MFSPHEGSWAIRPRPLHTRVRPLASVDGMWYKTRREAFEAAVTHFKLP